MEKYKLVEGIALRLRDLVALIVLVGVAFLAAHCSESSDPAAQSLHELYVMSKTEGIVVVNTENWKVLENIPLEEDYEPYSGLRSPDCRFLYVVGVPILKSNRPAPPDPGKVWVVDLSARKLVRTIVVDPFVKPEFVKGDDYLKLGGSKGEFVKGDDYLKLGGSKGEVLYLDTQTHQVAMTIPRPEPGAFWLLLNRDATKAFSMYSNFRFTSETSKKQKLASPPIYLRISSPGSQKQQVEIELPASRGWAAGDCCDMALSNDEKWLYIVNQGEVMVPRLYRGGMVYVVDVQQEKVVKQYEIPAACGEVQDPKSGSPIILSVSGQKDMQGKLHWLREDQAPQVTEVGNDPLEIRRLPNQAGFWVISRQDMRFLPEGASTFSSVVPLRRQKGSAEATQLLDDFPADILYLPTENRLVMGGVKKSDQLAIVDLKSKRIERIITVGRPGMKALNVAGDIVSTALGGSPMERISVKMAPSADGKYVYAFHVPTQDVTIFQTQDGTILEMIAAAGSEMGISPNGRFLYTYGSYGMTWIDLQIRKKAFDYRPHSGTIRGVQLLGNGDNVVALTSKSLVVWDATIGKQVATIEVLGEPSFVVEHSTKVQSSGEISLLNPEVRWWSVHPGFSSCLRKEW